MAETTVKLIFATNNKHKIEEVQAILGSHIQLISLNEIGCTDDIPETRNTIEGNAIQKAEFIYDRFQKNCFADDTGLEVESLDGKPGVNSARYAGPGHDFEANVTKLLSEMEGKLNRRAQFKTVIALIINGETHLFEGIIQGHIIEKRSGNEGFGYDPVFVPDGYNQTFAQMPAALKNSISHRAIATQKLVEYLKNSSK